MNKTKIAWCDYTWNPITGCSPISAGCDHCYAATISRRFGLEWGRSVFHEDRLGEPVLVRKPSRVFVCSMGDFWHETVQGEWRIAVGGAMQAAPWHTYIFLTKRPEAIGTVVQRLPENWWYGCTCENQAAVASRWPLIAALPAAVRFVSVEPMLGPVTFHGYHRPDWVIAGPETGPGARDFEAAWIGELSSESRCFFDKRNGEAGRRREWPR